MAGSRTPERTFGETLDSLRTFCSNCRHSDFVHSDRSRRPCLFSECDCPSFTVEIHDVGVRVQRGTTA